MPQQPAHSHRLYPGKGSGMSWGGLVGAGLKFKLWGENFNCREKTLIAGRKF